MSGSLPVAEGITNPSIDELLTKTDSKYKLVLYSAKRARQNRDWMHQLVNEMLLLRLKQNPVVRDMLPELERQVQNHEITAYAAARLIMDQF